MELEIIMLSEISQTKKGNYTCAFSNVESRFKKKNDMSIKWKPLGVGNNGEKRVKGDGGVNMNKILYIYV
jgi:hypothetical protein